MEQKMKMWQAIELLGEIEGLVEQRKVGKGEVVETNTVIKGLLNENISLKTKYNLNKNRKNLQVEKDFFISSRKEIVDKYIDDEGFIKDTKKANEEYAKLNDLDVNIELYKLEISDVDFQTEYNYRFTMEFLIKEEEQENGIS